MIATVSLWLFICITLYRVLLMIVDHLQHIYEA